MRLAIVLAVLLCSCSGGRDKAACEQVVDHVIEITGSKTPREDLVTRCVKDLSREELACAAAAASEADLKKCAGW